jgi:hypothetical protein
VKITHELFSPPRSLLFRTLYSSGLCGSRHRGTSLVEISAEAAHFTAVIYGEAECAMNGILRNMKKFHQQGKGDAVP